MASVSMEIIGRQQTEEVLVEFSLNVYRFPVNLENEVKNKVFR